MNWYELIAMLIKYFNISPSELNSMPYFKLEYLIKALKNIIEKEDKQKKKQEAEQKKNQPKLNSPKIPGFKMPKYLNNF
jgi:hypothetical protein